MGLTVKLHPAQDAFLKSDAPFRAFVGGIGSGKSWAGSYSLLKRSKPGRLYMVVAPSYTLLADATFRSFSGLAILLGLAGPGDIKRGAPLSIKLKTGAEVLFRSGDNPDSLYGPNLSGVFLDEASLMPRSVFNVCIGRLREGGEQGWLSACFTPRGKHNWCYETFATGRPDTAIFYCRTRDNPFLPAQFHSTVEQQYTSLQAREQLGGEFIDHEGGLFKRDWFAVVEVLPKIVSRVRCWDLASTPKDERRAHDPDFSVGALLGKGEDHFIYIEHIRRLRGSPSQVETAVRQTAEMDGRAVPVWIEEEGGSSGKVVSDHYARRVLNGFIFRSERPTGDKPTRAQPFAAASERGLVRLLKAPWNRDFLDEVELFPFGGHDDQVDAASFAFNKLASKKQLWVRCPGASDPSKDLIEVTYPDGRRERVPYQPGRHVDLRPDSPGWARIRGDSGHRTLSGW